MKEYNEYGELLFEGEYNNGSRNGKCKEYNESGKIIFEGTYDWGQKSNGSIREYEDDQLIFEAYYSCSRRNYKTVITISERNYSKYKTYYLE